ncbi:MAG: hypothetical protein ACQEQ4_04475 [Fibrobacterota bacterium]
MKTALIMISIVFCLTAEADFYMSGSTKLYPLFFSSVDTAFSILRTSVRAEGEWFFQNTIRAKSAWEISPHLYSESVPPEYRSGFNPKHTSYRVDDFRKTIVPANQNSEDAFVIFHNPDRLHITLPAQKFSITAGRQSMGWGSSHFIRPTDIITPFGFDAVDSENRIGVDAIVVRAPFGTMNEFEAGYVAGAQAQFSESAFFSRARFVTSRFGDISPLFIGFKKHLLLGMDYEKNIFDAGFSAEGALVIPGFFSDKNHPDDEYLRLSLGLHHRFTSRMHMRGEYHYNGAGNKDGTIDPDHTAYTHGNVYLLGKHYMGSTGSFEITPLFVTHLSFLANLHDPSAFIGLGAEKNLARHKNIYISAQINSGLGRGESPEFDTRPLLFYGGFRWYF